MDIEISYELFKIYLFYSKEVLMKNIEYNKKISESIIYIQNNIMHLFKKDKESFLKYINNIVFYYIEKKNKFQKMTENHKDRKQLLFLINNYNYFMKKTDVYYLIDKQNIKLYYIKFYENILTKRNFNKISKKIFEESIPCLKKSIEQINIENFTSDDEIDEINEIEDQIQTVTEKIDKNINIRIKINNRNINNICKKFNLIGIS